MKSKFLFFLLVFSVFAMVSCGDDEPGDVTVIDAKVGGDVWVDNMVEVALDATMEITFSKSIDPQKFSSNLTLSTTGPQFNFTASFNADSTIIILTPDVPLANQSEYILLITAGVLAGDGGMLVNDYERSFSTQ